MELDQIIKGCRKNDRKCQERLYGQFYNYAMTIARRYGGNEETAQEMVNDAFFKAFTKIDQYSGHLPFRQWLRRIVINTAIDRYRSTINQAGTTSLEVWHEQEDLSGIEEQLTYEQIVALLDRLPPAYRAVFNLAVVDGYSHEEVATYLGISIGASKSNLSRARQHLKNMLSNDFEFSKHI